jgi:double-stranded uracil-DNA glycosylase
MAVWRAFRAHDTIAVHSRYQTMKRKAALATTRQPALGGGSFLPDVIGPGLAVVFCGINPGARAAAAGHNFVGAGNRFWRAINLAGFTPEQIAAEQDQTLLRYGCGLTTAVARPTRRADELSHDELVAAEAVLRAKIERYAPRTLAFLGKAAYAAIAAQKSVAWGRQAATFAGASVWVLPNPSGLNRGFSLGALVKAYSELRLAAQDDLRAAVRCAARRPTRALLPG